LPDSFFGNYESKKVNESLASNEKVYCSVIEEQGKNKYNIRSSISNSRNLKKKFHHLKKIENSYDYIIDILNLNEDENSSKSKLIESSLANNRRISHILSNVEINEFRLKNRKKSFICELFSNSLKKNESDDENNIIDYYFIKKKNKNYNYNEQPSNDNQKTITNKKLILKKFHSDNELKQLSRISEYFLKNYFNEENKINFIQKKYQQISNSGILNMKNQFTSCFKQYKDPILISTYQPYEIFNENKVKSKESEKNFRENIVEKFQNVLINNNYYFVDNNKIQLQNENSNDYQISNLKNSFEYKPKKFTSNLFSNNNKKFPPKKNQTTYGSKKKPSKVGLNSVYAYKNVTSNNNNNKSKNKNEILENMLSQINLHSNEKNSNHYLGNKNKAFSESEFDTDNSFVKEECRKLILKKNKKSTEAYFKIYKESKKITEDSKMYKKMIYLPIFKKFSIFINQELIKVNENKKYKKFLLKFEKIKNLIISTKQKKIQQSDIFIDVNENKKINDKLNKNLKESNIDNFIQDYHKLIFENLVKSIYVNSNRDITQISFPVSKRILTRLINNLKSGKNQIKKKPIYYRLKNILLKIFNFKAKNMYLNITLINSQKRPDCYARFGNNKNENIINIINEELNKKEVLNKEISKIKNSQKIIRGVFLPNSTFRLIWDIIVSIGVIYNLFYIPLVFLSDFSVSKPEIGYIEIIDAFIDGCSFLDIVLNFRTGFVDSSNHIVVNLKEIRENYLKYLFYFDISSSIPYELFTSNRNIYLVNLLKLPRMLRIIRLIKLTDKLKYKHLFKIIYLFFIYFLLAHWLGCLFFLFLDFSFINKTMQIKELEECTYYDNIGLINHKSECKYLFSLFNGMSLMEAQVINTEPDFSQIIILIFEYFIGQVALNILFSGISSSFKNIDYTEKTYNNKIKLITEHMDFCDIKGEIRNHIEGYYEYIWNKHSSQIMRKIPIENITPLMKEKISVYQFKNAFAFLPFINVLNLDDRVISFLFKFMELRIFIPKELIFLEGNVTKGLYILSKGKINNSINAVEKFIENRIDNLNSRAKNNQINKNNLYYKINNANYDYYESSNNEKQNNVKIKDKENLKKIKFKSKIEDNFNYNSNTDKDNSRNYFNLNNKKNINNKTFNNYEEIHIKEESKNSINNNNKDYMKNLNKKNFSIETFGNENTINNNFVNQNFLNNETYANSNTISNNNNKDSSRRKLKNNFFKFTQQTNKEINISNISNISNNEITNSFNLSNYKDVFEDAYNFQNYVVKKTKVFSNFPSSNMNDRRNNNNLKINDDGKNIEISQIPKIQNEDLNKHHILIRNDSSQNNDKYDLKFGNENFNKNIIKKDLFDEDDFINYSDNSKIMNKLSKNKIKKILNDEKESGILMREISEKSIRNTENYLDKNNSNNNFKRINNHNIINSGKSNVKSIFSFMEKEKNVSNNNKNNRLSTKSIFHLNKFDIKIEKNNSLFDNINNELEMIKEFQQTEIIHSEGNSNNSNSNNHNNPILNKNEYIYKKDEEFYINFLSEFQLNFNNYINEKNKIEFFDEISLMTETNRHWYSCYSNDMTDIIIIKYKNLVQFFNENEYVFKYFLKKAKITESKINLFSNKVIYNIIDIPSSKTQGEKFMKGRLKAKSIWQEENKYAKEINYQVENIDEQLEFIEEYIFDN